MKAFETGGAPVRAALLGICLSALGACGEAYRYLTSGDVGWALKKEIRDRNAKEVAIAKLAPFEWDELYLFSPYMRTELICAKLALGPAECGSRITKESADDGQMLMVFRRQGRVVHVEMHYRIHGDFIPAPAGQPLTPANAIFVVAARRGAAGGEPWPKLELKRRP